ncbi:DUF4861 domain-containing protein [Chitinophagaceae bacterium LB-8]|uniref:DUF4861 domain-containing protein n=1 Tax=Paraflavisolibacter caeni TaxID=2982496 RepID=A0A9X3BHZ8_9BACT|nr:DUF4861 domain-containing protein [Paraflavisolibacter caeni]MCU7549428.1 DUF4861 domain-containing protein [Paraflavisolibacter caeni]
MIRNVLFIWLSITIVVSFSCKNGSNSGNHQIILTNTSDVKLTDKPVIIKRQDLPYSKDSQLFPLITSSNGDTIQAQLDDTDHDKKWDELFFVIDLSPKEEKTLSLAWTSSPIKYENRSHVRFGVRQTKESHVAPAMSDTFYADQLPGVIGYQHYQTDGPTWENDKVGFRQYLDGRNSIDVFGKTVSYMTPDSVGIGKDGYTENNYSVMKDWGTDILAVANSVGIGGISLMIKDSLARLGVTEQDSINNVDSTIFRIQSNGPVRSIMNFSYKGWKPLDRNLSVEQTTSIWPGMYAFKNTVSIDHLQGDEQLLIGLANSNTAKKPTELILNDQWVALLTHDKQSINKTWYLGMALILPKDVYQGYIEAPKQGRVSNTFLGRLKIRNHQPISYYAVACWELTDPQFSKADYFTNYVRNMVDQMTAEVKVKIQ